MAPKLYMFYGNPAVGSVLITAKAVGIPLELKELNYVNREHLSPAYLKLNPQHAVPTLEEEDGFSIQESQAINAYLVGKYGNDDTLYPKDLKRRALVNEKLYFESGTLFPLLRTVDAGYMRKKIKEVPVHLVTEIKNSYKILETFLDGHQWVAGDDITIADFNLVSTILCLDYHVKVDSKSYPNIADWLKRALALPCFSSHSDTMARFNDFFDSIKELR